MSFSLAISIRLKLFCCIINLLLCYFSSYSKFAYVLFSLIVKLKGAFVRIDYISFNFAFSLPRLLFVDQGTLNGSPFCKNYTDERLRDNSSSDIQHNASNLLLVLIIIIVLQDYLFERAILQTYLRENRMISLNSLKTKIQVSTYIFKKFFIDVLCGLRLQWNAGAEMKIITCV